MMATLTAMKEAVRRIERLNNLLLELKQAKEHLENCKKHDACANVEMRWTASNGYITTLTSEGLLGMNLWKGFDETLLQHVDVRIQQCEFEIAEIERNT